VIKITTRTTQKQKALILLFAINFLTFQFASSTRKSRRPVTSRLVRTLINRSHVYCMQVCSGHQACQASRVRGAHLVTLVPRVIAACRAFVVLLAHKASPVTLDSQETLVSRECRASMVRLESLDHVASLVVKASWDPQVMHSCTE